MVPQPVKAIVLLFPITETYEAARKAEDAQIAAKGQHPLDPTVLWIKQTVRTVLHDGSRWPSHRRLSDRKRLWDDGPDSRARKRQDGIT